MGGGGGGGERERDPSLSWLSLTSLDSAFWSTSLPPRNLCKMSAHDRTRSPPPPASPPPPLSTLSRACQALWAMMVGLSAVLDPCACACMCVCVCARACVRAWVLACVVCSRASAHAHARTRHHRCSARARGRGASGCVVVRIARVAPAERRRSRQFRLAPSASCVASDSPSPQHIAQQHPLPLRTRVQAFQSASALALLPLRSATCRLQSRIRPSHHTRARNDVSPVADPRAAAPHTRQGPSRRAKMATALFRPAIRGFGKHTRGAARPRLVSPSRRVHLHPSPASTPIMHA